MGLVGYQETYALFQFTRGHCSPPQRLEGNKLSVSVDGPSCVAAVAHRNFYSEVEPILSPTFSNLKFKAYAEESTRTQSGR